MNDLLIGIIQGITEFLPISSSGHLVIFSSISETVDLNTNDIAFLHIGTLFSILFFYRKRISETLAHKEELQHTIKIIIIAIIPAVLVGRLSPIQKTIDKSENLLTITGLAYLCFASLLLFYEISMKNKETENVLFKNINSKHALVIGLAQAIALVPGVSRSGITLMVGLYLGIRKADAIYFSLLLGIPTIFGAWLLTFIETSYAFNPGIVIPVLVASISGFLAIKLLVSFTLNAKLKYFGFYCLLLSVICFIN